MLFELLLEKKYVNEKDCINRSLLLTSTKSGCVSILNRGQKNIHPSKRALIPRNIAFRTLSACQVGLIWIYGIGISSGIFKHEKEQILLIVM